MWRLREDREAGDAMRGNTFIITRRDRKFTALKFPRQCPLALLVTVGWKQGTALESEEGRVMRNGLLGVCSRGK
jgi:hypothetical protein